MIVCVLEHIFEEDDSYPQMATWFIDLDKLSKEHPYRVAIEEAIKFRQETGSDVVNYEFDGEVNFSDSPASILASGEDFDEDYPNPLVYNFPFTVEAMVRLCVVDDYFASDEDDADDLDEEEWRLMQMTPPTTTLN